MICNKCNSNIPDGSTFCPVCGQQFGAPAQTTAYQQPAYQQPAAPVSVLPFGILSLVFAGTGIIGLIFAIIGLSKSKKFVAQNGSLFGSAKVGKILSIIGLVSSIVMLALIPLYIFVFTSDAFKFGLALSNLH